MTTKFYKKLLDPINHLIIYDPTFKLSNLRQIHSFLDPSLDGASNVANAQVGNLTQTINVSLGKNDARFDWPVRQPARRLAQKCTKDEIDCIM